MNQLLHLDDREALLVELTGFTSADISDFATLIKGNNSINKSNQDPAEIISQHLSAAQDIGDRLTSSVMAQDDLLKEILIGNENFIKARKSDPITVKRDTMVRTLLHIYKLLCRYELFVLLLFIFFVLFF